MALEEREKQKFQKRLQETYQSLAPSTCNILLLGNTGAGKSSLTNQVFGTQVTKSGVGNSITQKFLSFESKDHQLRIYDSKGIEIGNYMEFCEQLEFFLKQQETIHYQEHIHCVWILVDGSQSRVDTHWKQLCESILKKFSILFIISKVDLLGPQEEADLRNAIQSLEISNLEGIFSIISLENLIPKVSHCEKCQSNRLLLDSVEKVVICQQCQTEIPFEHFQKNNQMKQLIERTIQILPKQQKISFISSQKVHIEVKKQEADLFLKKFNEGLLNEIGLFDPEVKKADLIVGLYRIYGLSGDIDLTVLMSINTLISNVSGLFQLSPIGELLKCGTKIVSLYLHGRTLNQILYESSRKMVESFSEESIKKIFEDAMNKKIDL